MMSPVFDMHTGIGGSDKLGVQVGITLPQVVSPI